MFHLDCSPKSIENCLALNLKEGGIKAFSVRNTSFGTGTITCLKLSRTTDLHKNMVQELSFYGDLE